jgi:hypothetical protein
MQDSFIPLQELLLRGGIAPRHVKRYLRELTEHLADLTEAQRDLGYDEADARVRARTALGPDAELADAMIRQRDFRSLSARFPWAVFGLMPFAALLLAAFLQIVLFIVLARLTGGIGFGPHASTVPSRLLPLAAVMQVFGNFLLVPGVALAFVGLALRQRLSPLWPLLSTLVIAGLSLHWDIVPWNPDPHGWGAAGLSYRAGHSAIRFGVTPVFLYAWWKAMAAHGLEQMLQYALVLLPLAWLLRARRKAAA